MTTTPHDWENPAVVQRNKEPGHATLIPFPTAAAAATTPHRHVKTEEIYYILAGQGLMRVEEESCEVGPGDAIAIPPGASHQPLRHDEARRAPARAGSTGERARR